MSKIYVSKEANSHLIKYLEEQGHKVSLMESKADIDPPISCHPDIYMCQLNPGMIFHGKPEKLGRDYPYHAIYNGCSTGKYFIHNLKLTDAELLEAVSDSGLISVHVPQGYSKCSIVVVDDNSIITSDRGIFKAASKAGLDILLIEPKQVILHGYPYGFLGGASGRIGDTILFNGDLSKHSDFNEISRFITSRGLKIKYFAEYPLTDIGSIIQEKE